MAPAVTVLAGGFLIDLNLPILALGCVHKGYGQIVAKIMPPSRSGPSAAPAAHTDVKEVFKNAGKAREYLVKVAETLESAPLESISDATGEIACTFD